MAAVEASLVTAEAALVTAEEQEDKHGEETLRHWESLDYCLSKDILEEGDRTESVFPRFGAKAIVEISHLEGVNLDTPIAKTNYLKNSSNDGEKSFNKEFHIGWSVTELDRSLDKLLMTMRPGEKARVSARVQNESDHQDFALAECTLKLISLQNVDPVYKWPPEVKLEKADDLYKVAVGLYKDGDADEAFLAFRKALNLLTFVAEGENYQGPKADQPLMEGQKAPTPPTAGLLKDKAAMDKVRELKAKCISNLSLCQMKFGNFEHVIQLTKEEDCSAPSDVKTLYRRGVAHTELGDLDEALATFEKALTLEPSNKAVLAKMNEAKTKKSRCDSNLQTGLKKMFAS